MKTTLLLALTLMLNLLTDTNSAESGLLYPRFQQLCCINGIPFEPNISYSDVIATKDFPPLKFDVPESDVLIVRHMPDAIIFTPKNPDDEDTLSKGVLDPEVYRYKQGIAQFRNSSMDEMENTGNKSKVEVMYILLFQKYKDRLNNSLNNAVVTIRGAIGDSSNFTKFKEVLDRVRTIGSETETTTSSVEPSAYELSTLPYYYASFADCNDPDTNMTYSFMHFEPPINANLTQADFNAVKNLTMVMKMPSNVQKMKDTDVYKIYKVQAVEEQ